MIDYRKIADIVGEDKIQALRDAGVNIADKPNQPTTNLLGRWAKHAEYGDVLIASDKVDDGYVSITVRDEFDRHGAVYDYVAIADLTFPEQTTRPEDVPVGEAWLVNANDGIGSAERVIAIKVNRRVWASRSEGKTLERFWYDPEVTLITPLIPANPQDQGQPSDLTPPEQTTRPEDVSPGEAWLMNVDHIGESAERINAVKLAGDKWIVGSCENIARIWENHEVGLIAPLIPARPRDADRDESPETVTTEKEYEALPEGSIVAHPGGNPWFKDSDGAWNDGHSSVTSIAYTPRRVIRRGWGE